MGNLGLVGLSRYKSSSAGLATAGDSTERVRSPGGDGEFGVVESEESDG